MNLNIYKIYSVKNKGEGSGSVECEFWTTCTYPYALRRCTVVNVSLRLKNDSDKVLIEFILLYITTFH